jgi:uncharacterized damage-inducible protein DinB
MNPLRTYDYLCRARALVLDKVRPLTDEQLARVFPIGPGTLARTLTHTMISEWYYVQRMQGRDVPPYAHWPIREEDPPAFAVLECAWREQAAATRHVVEEVLDWDAPFEYTVTDDHGCEMIVTASAADLFTQLVLHEVHHRAQALNMLRTLGVAIDRDIDFNAMMYPRRAGPK